MSRGVAYEQFDGDVKSVLRVACRAKWDVNHASCTKVIVYCNKIGKDRNLTCTLQITGDVREAKVPWIVCF